MAYYVTEPGDGESSSNRNAVAAFNLNFFSLSNHFNRESTALQLAPSPQMQNNIEHIIASVPMQTTNTNVGIGGSFRGFGVNFSANRNKSRVDPNALNATEKMYKASVEGWNRADHENQQVFKVFII